MVGRDEQTACVRDTCYEKCAGRRIRERRAGDCPRLPSIALDGCRLTLIDDHSSLGQERQTAGARSKRLAFEQLELVIEQSGGESIPSSQDRSARVARHVAALMQPSMRPTAASSAPTEAAVAAQPTPSVVVTAAATALATVPHHSSSAVVLPSTRTQTLTRVLSAAEAGLVSGALLAASPSLPKLGATLEKPLIPSFRLKEIGEHKAELTAFASSSSTWAFYNFRSDRLRRARNQGSSTRA